MACPIWRLERSSVTSRTWSLLFSMATLFFVKQVLIPLPYLIVLAMSTCDCILSGLLCFEIDSMYLSFWVSQKLYIVPTRSRLAVFLATAVPGRMTFLWSNKKLLLSFVSFEITLSRVVLTPSGTALLSFTPIYWPVLIAESCNLDNSSKEPLVMIVLYIFLSPIADATLLCAPSFISYLCREKFFLAGCTAVMGLIGFPAGRLGFCAMTNSSRSIPETESPSSS